MTPEEDEEEEEMEKKSENLAPGTNHAMGNQCPLHPKTQSDRHVEVREGQAMKCSIVYIQRVFQSLIFSVSCF